MEIQGLQTKPVAPDNTALTHQLFEKISCFHSVPRLRQKLVKVAFTDFDSQVPVSHEKDLVYLISGLSELLHLALDPKKYPNLPRDLGEYLRHCESYGLAVRDFLSGSVKAWEDIRPKYQELGRSQLAGFLHQHFPRLKNESADCFAGYLLTHSLARLIPPFPFEPAQRSASLVAVRAQNDLSWNLVSHSADCLSALQTHFPEIDWVHQCSERKLWFIGIRLLSQSSPKTASVLRNTLAGVAYLSTSKVQNRKKLLNVVLFSEGDLNLFKFNLHHYAKLAGTYYEIFVSSLTQYREGYPGLSGFIDEELRYGATAGEN